MNNREVYFFNNISLFTVHQSQIITDTSMTVIKVIFTTEYANIPKQSTGGLSCKLFIIHQ